MANWIVRRVLTDEMMAYVGSQAGMTAAQYEMACGREVDIGSVEADTKGAAISRAYAEYKIPPAELLLVPTPAKSAVEKPSLRES